MKIIIETFSDNRFPCITSVVFKATTISILQDILVRRTEQFDTTHDFLGQKLTKLEKCIFRSARDHFEKSLLFFLSAPLCSNRADYVLLLFIYYRHPCVATEQIMFYFCLFFLFIFFIHRLFSETTRPILTKFSGIVYSGVV